MCHSSVWLVLGIIATASSDPADIESIDSIDSQPYTFSFSNPSTLNFQDIYTSIVTSAEDTSRTALIDDDQVLSTTEEIGYVLIKDKSQYVEFHPELTMEPSTEPPPKYILNSTFLQRVGKSKKKVTTTEEPDDIIKVVPINKIERGVLDLLFPESRVKAFKNIFDTVRRMLSHTFR